MTASSDGPTTLGDTTTLTATVETGDAVSYLWDFGDGSPPDDVGAVVSHVYLEVGTFTAIVTASNDVSVQSATTTVVIQDVPPVAVFATSSPDVLGETTTFSNTSSGSNLSFEWNFGDGSPIDTAVDPQHTYATTGTFTVVLTATNSAGSDTASAQVVIEEPLVGLLVYPHLGETTATLVVISWATDGAGASEVRYSLDQGYGDVVAATSSTYDAKYWHSATLTGLTADTTYYYRVYTAGDDVTSWSEVTFTTAPEATAPRFTFVALGDSRPDGTSSPPSQGALDVAAELGQHSFDLALHTGDIVNSGGICSGDDSSWNQYVRVYFDLYQQSIGDTPFYPSVGNHELNGGNCGYQGYTDVYHLPENAPSGDKEEYYSFDWGNAHFVALDTNQDYSVGSAQCNWLVNDLQTSTQPWKFVFFHHPAYSSGIHGSTSEVQTHLVPIFETYGVDVVFSGHDHHYERTCPILNGVCTTPQDGGVVYYVTGGGGAPLYPAIDDWFTAHSGSLYHFLKVEVDGSGLRLNAIDTTGNIFDSYEINH